MLNFHMFGDEISLGSDGMEFQGSDNAHQRPHRHSDHVPGRCIVFPLQVLGTQNEGDISDRFWGVQIHDSRKFGG